MERLVDLDELLLRCRTEQARNYLAEAIVSYRAGAYRASVVTAWIAVVFDVIDKLRELALSGDGKAKHDLEKFEQIQEQLDNNNKQAITAALQFEHGVLDLARHGYELIDNQQYADLIRLREDRNRCAHPTFQRFGAPYQPSAELVRMHLRNVIIHLLQHPPVQGKAALSALRQVVASEYFPNALDKAKISLQESGFLHPTTALIRGLIDLLVFGFFTKGDALYFQKRTLMALHAVLQLQRAEAEPRLCEQLNKIIGKLDDDQLILIIAILGELPECWNGLQLSHRDRIDAFVRLGPISQIAMAISFVTKLSALAQALIARVGDLKSEELATTIKSLVSKERAKSIPADVTGAVTKRAVELYTDSKSWPTANSEAERLIFPLLPYLKAADVEAILRSPKEKGNDLVGSHGFYNFLKQITQSGAPISSDALYNLLKAQDLDRYVDMLKADELDSEIPF